MVRRELLSQLLSVGAGAGALCLLPAGCGPKAENNEPQDEEAEEKEQEEYYENEKEGSEESDDADDSTSSEGE